MEDAIYPRNEKEIENDRLKSDVTDYTNGLNCALGLSGRIGTEEEEKIYSKANDAGDRLFGQERENAGVRTGDFASKVKAFFGDNVSSLQEGIRKYSEDLLRLRTGELRNDPKKEEVIRNETIDLQNKINGQGINRIVF